MKRVRIAIAEGHNWKEALNDYVFAYRITPHSTTGIPPAEALFGRKLRSKLPQIALKGKDDEEMRDADTLHKQISKENADVKRRARDSDIKPGDTVLLRQPYQNKFSTPYSDKKCSVVQRAGNSVQVATPDGVVLKRNITHVKKFIKEENSDGDDRKITNQNKDGVHHNETSTINPPERKTLPVRHKHTPGKFKDFKMG
jgi:hypothetical protein